MPSPACPIHGHTSRSFRHDIDCHIIAWVEEEVAWHCKRADDTNMPLCTGRVFEMYVVVGFKTIKAARFCLPDERAPAGDVMRGDIIHQR